MIKELAEIDLMADRLLPNHPTLRHPRTGERLRAIGIVDGRTIWPVLGAAEDDDSDDSADDDSDDDSDDADEDDSDDDKKLGPKGERALAAEKEKRRKARAAQQKAERERDDARAELDRLKKKSKGKATKDDADDDDDDDDDGLDRRRDRDDEADKRANRKLVRAEIKSLAADSWIDADDAYRYLDLDNYEVDEDGDIVNLDDLKEDLEDELKKRPHLGKKRRRVEGDGDGGNRGGGGSKNDPGPGRNRMRAAYADAEKTRRRTSK